MFFVYMRTSGPVQSENKIEIDVTNVKQSKENLTEYLHGDQFETNDTQGTIS